MGRVATECVTSQGLNCYLCGTAFWVEGELYRRRRDDRLSFWCPNGHEQHFTGDTPKDQEIARLKREAADARERAEREARSRSWAESRAKGANIAAGKAKAKMRRTLERVNAGVCPHCHRTFKQLVAHMACKHADEIKG